MKKKQKNKYKSKGIGIDLIVMLLAIPFIVGVVGFALWYLDVQILKATYSYFEIFLEKGKDVFTISACLWILLLIAMFKMFQFKKPKQDDDLASARWTTIPEQKKFFGIAPIDTTQDLEIGGSPVNMISPTELLYEKEATQSICVGSTRSGKSRKLIRQLVMICSMANESMIFNDPKKEFYQDFHKYLEKKGYQILLLDLRNLQYSDCWNPMNNIIKCIEENKIDDADQYAQDIVTAIVVDSGSGEKIWIDGQKALIKGLILAVCASNLPQEQKNFYSVYQTLALLGGEIPVLGKHTQKMEKKMILSIFMESLKESNIARVAYTAVANSPEKTKGSFMTSALATLNIFSSRKLAKVMSRSDFQFQDFANGKKALFVVNPDEKTTYDVVASMVFDQAYQELVFEANKLSGRKLEKRVHMILDETGNMPEINNLGRKITVALSREIIYHLYVQDFGQLVTIYGAEVAKTIRSNCNLWYFISSADYDTCEEISKKVGEETIWVDSLGGNYSQAGGASGGNVNYSKQTRRLIDANELVSADNREGDGIIVVRTYTQPAKVFLPDASQYSWYKQMEHDETEIERKDQTLKWAVPRFFEWKEKEDSEVVEETNFRKQAMKSVQPPNEKHLFWYWSMRDDLQESVMHYMNKRKKEREELRKDFNIQAELESNEFSLWLRSVDILDEDIPIESDSIFDEHANKEYETTALDAIFDI